MKCFKCGQEVEVKEFASHYHEKHRTMEDIEVRLGQFTTLAGQGMKGASAGHRGDRYTWANWNNDNVDKG